MSVFERPDANFKNNSVAKTFLREFNFTTLTPEKAIYSPVFNSVTTISRDLGYEWRKLIENKEHVLEPGTYIGGGVRGKLTQREYDFLWTSFISFNPHESWGNGYGYCDYYYNRIILNSEFLIIPFIKVIENTKFSLNSQSNSKKLCYPIHISAVGTTLVNKMAVIYCRCYEGNFTTSVGDATNSLDYGNTFFINNKNSRSISNTPTITLENIFNGNNDPTEYMSPIDGITAYNNTDCRNSPSCINHTRYVNTVGPKNFSSNFGDSSEYWGTYPFRRVFRSTFNDEQTKLNISADIPSEIFKGSTGVEPFVKISNPIITGCNVKIIKKETK